jgi:hypothetical protein
LIRHRSAIILFLVLLLLPVVSPRLSADPFIPVDDTPADNAYNMTGHYALQWWYFDAVFSSQASVHIGIVTIGAGGVSGFYLLQLQYYDSSGNLSRQARRLVPIKIIHASTDGLLLSLGKRQFVREYSSDGQDRVMDVNLSLGGMVVNLTFVDVMKGWKGSTDLGMWGCPFPKADVHGTIIIDREATAIEGTGYQEHGWDIRNLHRSWFWGKIVSEHLNLVFSQNMKSRTEEDVFVAVVNSGAENYSGIARENITFMPTAYAWMHGRRVPVQYLFLMDQGDFHLNVTLRVISVHFSTVVLMNYYRFHVRVVGTMSLGDVVDPIDDVQIMEHFYFP